MGDGKVIKPKFVAELSINHLGMVSIAKQMILAAQKSGADYIKLKLKNVNKYYKDDGKKWRNFPFKLYRGSLELSRDDFFEIDKFCKELGIKWFTTVHDEESLDFVSQFDPPFYKIASMDASKSDFVDLVMNKCKKEDRAFVISIGGKSDSFTKDIIAKIDSMGLKANVLHTVSIYPTPVGQSNINYIRKLKAAFETDKIRIGYSGHEVGYAASLLAASIGVGMIERHFTLSRDINIHHINAALNPGEFKSMVDLISEVSEENNTEAADFSVEEFKFLEDRTYE